MIDLHAHVLPAVDDGPADLEGSLALLRMAATSRTRVIAATPHLRADYPEVRVESIGSACAALQEWVPPEWDLQIVPAGEVDLLWALGATDEQLCMASYGQRGTDLLVETPHGRLFDDFEDTLAALADRGYRVVLAHPELNSNLQRRPERLEHLVERGVLLQVTAASLTRVPRKSKSARLARWLVEREYAHVIASDAHSGGAWRPPGLTSALRVARELSPSRALWMVTAAPAAILAGRPLPCPSPAE